MAIRGVVFDIDGVLEWRGEVCAGAVETIDALRRMGLTLRLLTNSTLKSRRSCADRLRSGGVCVVEEEVITASHATAAYLAQLRPRSCWVLLDGDGLEEFAEFEQDREDPEYVVVGDYREQFGFANLNHALGLLRRGAKLVGMQSELVDRSAGMLELNVGSWVGMLERAARVEATYVGKPHRYAFDLTLRTMGLEAAEVLMVGDQVGIDIKGAKAVGMRAALVQAGGFDARELPADVRPDHVLESIVDVVAVVSAGA